MKIQALLVSKPGPLRDALSNLIASLPDMSAPNTGDTGLLALKAMRQNAPQLVIIAGTIAPDEAVELVHHIKQTEASARCLVLAQSLPHAQQLSAAGADQVFYGDVSGHALLVTLEQMLSEIRTAHDSRQAGEQ